MLQKEKVAALHRVRQTLTFTSLAEEAFIPMDEVNQYDAFLSHNSADKEAVETIAQRLRQEAKLQPFLDKWHLIPGKPWQEGLEEALDQSHACAVFLGPSGPGPWENEEMRAALDQRVRNKSFRVIPVWLPGADPKDETTLPRFLRRLTWVDFRQGLEDKEAFHQLICGIKGILPEPVEPQSIPKPVFPTWNVPYRQNPYFTGRKELLETLHQALTTEHTTALTQSQAITGLGGIGKTQTALEYAYRHQKDYRIIWWLRAEEPTTLAADYAKLAIKLNLPGHEATEQAIQIQAVRNWLEQHTGWLLIFDNAEERHDVRPYLPQMRNGHVIITSRNPIWDSLGTTLPVEVMQLEEALAFLVKRIKDPEPQAAINLAETLGYLPLALEQAAAYIRENSIPLDEYQELFQKHHAQLLQYGPDHRINHFQLLKMIVKVFERLFPLVSRRFARSLQHSHLSTEYPDTVATTWKLSFQKAQKTSPATADFLNLCAFLAPDAIFLDMITEGATYVPKRLAKTITDPLALNELISPLLHYSLLQKESNKLIMHRLVQSVLRDRLSPAKQRRWAKRAVQIINQAFPISNFSTWSRCEQLLPHAQICVRWIKKWELTSKETGQLLHGMGSYFYDRTAYTEAELLYQQALTITEKTLGSKHLELAKILNNLANLYRHQGRYIEAEPLYQQALTITEKVLGPEHADLANTLDNLAGLYASQGRYTEAEPLFQQALAIQKKVFKAEHEHVGTTLSNLALLYYDQGRYAEAEPLLQRALAINEKALGSDHPNVATILNNLALLYLDQGYYAEAESLHQRALAITEKALGPEHPDVAKSLNNLALLYYTQGQYEQAEPLFQRALDIWEKALGPEHPDVALSLNNLAALYRTQGQYEQAEPLYQRALDIYEKALGPEHPDVAKSLNNLAELYRTQGQYEQAEPLFQRALDIWEKALGPDHKNGYFF